MDSAHIVQNKNQIKIYYTCNSLIILYFQKAGRESLVLQ